MAANLVRVEVEDRHNGGCVGTNGQANARWKHGGRTGRIRLGVSEERSDWVDGGGCSFGKRIVSVGVIGILKDDPRGTGIPGNYFGAVGKVVGIIRPHFWCQCTDSNQQDGAAKNTGTQALVHKAVHAKRCASLMAVGGNPC